MTQKVAVVMAGGRGMGASAARHLAEKGYGIGLLSVSGNAEALAQELGGVGVTGSNLETADLKKLIEAVMDRWGRIDVVINSAGHAPKGEILEISDDDWHTAMDYYLMNVIRSTRLVTPIMVEQGGGTIINISSFAAVQPDLTFVTSGVFRTGLSSFAKMFSDRYAADNVRMNNVLPGFIDSLPEKDERRARVPLGRYGKMEEVAALIAYLASDEAAYITGQNFRIDGGMTRSV
ncbi:MAG: SDR family oxidoreductase [Pseudomonadota bacterium]